MFPLEGLGVKSVGWECVGAGDLVGWMGAVWGHLLAGAGRKLMVGSRYALDDSLDLELIGSDRALPGAHTGRGRRVVELAAPAADIEIGAARP
jgi:hypothetical protein